MALDSQAVLDKYNLNQPNMPLRNLTAGRVDVQPVVAAVRWLPVLIWQLTIAEMIELGVAGQTVCFHIVLDVDGKPIATDDLRRLNTSLRYGWDNGETHNTPFEKPWPEPSANFAMGNGGRYWAEIESPLAASARVYGISLHNPDDRIDPNAHHVTVVVWQRHTGDVIVIADPPPTMPPVAGYKTIKTQAINDHLAALDAQIAGLTAMRRKVASWLQ